MDHVTLPPEVATASGVARCSPVASREAAQGPSNATGTNEPADYKSLNEQCVNRADRCNAVWATRRWLEFDLHCTWPCQGNGINASITLVGGKLVLITNRKSYISFQLVQKSVTLNDLERRMALFCVISANSGSFRAHCVKVHVRYLICWWVLVIMLCTILLQHFCRPVITHWTCVEKTEPTVT